MAFRIPRFWWTALLAVAAFGSGALPPAHVQAERPAARLLVLDAEVASGLPEAAVLQLALEHELGVAVKIGRADPTQPTLRVRSAGEGRAQVSLTIEGKTSPGRALALPAEPARAAETIALLAANLLHDEASELLAELQRRPTRKSVPAASELETAAPIEDPPSAATASTASTASTSDLPAATSPTEPGATWVVDFLPGVSLPSPAAPERHVSIGVAGSFAPRVNGLQVAPLLAYSPASVSGVQAAAVTMAGDVHGLQFGLLNLARGHAAWQVGLLNLGRDADVGVGLLSLYRHGRTQFQAMSNLDRQTLMAVKHGSRRVHNVLAFGAQPDAQGNWQPVAGYGIGTRVSLFDRLYVDLDAQQQFSRGVDRRFVTQTQLAALAAVRVVGHWRVFAGPTYSVKVERDELALQPNADTGPHRRGGDFRLLGQLGLSAGVSW